MIWLFRRGLFRPFGPRGVSSPGLTRSRPTRRLVCIGGHRGSLGRAPGSTGGRKSSRRVRS
jgi:hypothetical protein